MAQNWPWGNQFKKQKNFDFQEKLGWDSGGMKITFFAIVDSNRANILAKKTQIWNFLKQHFNFQLIRET